MNCFQIHYSLYQISYTILNYCFYCKQDKSCFYRLYLTRATQFNYKLLTIIFHRFRNNNNNGIILSIQLQYIDFLQKSILVSVCRTITLCVLPVWPIVLYVKIPLPLRLQCRTDTLRLPNLSVYMQNSYCLFQGSFTESCR